MPARYFTPNEVNAILPIISALMGELLMLRAKIVHDAREIQPLLQLDGLDVGGQELNAFLPLFDRIDALTAEVKGHGCIIKDVNGGLIDFLARRHGREVYLCWRYGEDPVIRHFHDLHTGFQGRQPVRQEDFE